MAIIDYPRQTSPRSEDGDHNVVIPPFHAGGLGFLSDVQIHLGLLTGKNRVQACEVVACAFPGQMGHRFTCEASFLDEPGLIHRVAAAIASVGVSVVDKNSSLQFRPDREAILHLRFVLDWTTNAEFRERLDSTPVEIERYDYLRERIPIRDYRFLCLYEAIMECCADRVMIDRRYGTELPAIDMVPFSYRTSEYTQTATIPVEGRIGKKFYNQIKLPASFVSKIASATGQDKAESLTYLLSSDPISRTLRIFFPTADSVRRIHRVGLRHVDQSYGPVATFSYGIGAMEANILNSLLRKYDDEESIWEVTFEYLGLIEDLPQLPAKPEELLTWFKDRIEKRNDHRTIASFAEYRTRVSEPDYPKRTTQFSVEIGRLDDGDNAGGELEPSYPVLESQVEAVLLRPVQRVREDRRRELCADVAASQRHDLPRVFLSYSEASSSYAEQIQALSALEDVVIFTEFQAKNNDDKLAGARRAIRESDYLLGIWHPDEDTGMISPWMFAEWAWAKDSGRGTMIVQRSGIARRAGIRRLDDVTLHFDFDPAHFAKDACPEIIAGLKSFALQWRLRRSQNVDPIAREGS